MQSLEARVADRTKDPWETLDERSAKDCSQLAANIEELQRSIEGVLKEVSDLQNEFEFVNELTGSERDQRQRDLEALRNSAPASPPSLTNSPANWKINSVAMPCPSPRCFRSRSPSSFHSLPSRR